MTEKPSFSSRSVAAAVAGNVLEFYDFLTYSFFAVTIGKQFFPAKDEFVSLLLSVCTFGIGFVTRPIGGLVIGAYADRAGRKPAMMLTVALMAIGMLMIALMPPYAKIGAAAPLLIMLARLIQGFALGGEVGPATTFLVEGAPPARRGYYASWQIAAQGIATLMAGLVGVGLAAVLPQAVMDSWGWRIPFLIGVSIIPVAIFMRRHLPETAHLDDPAVTHHGLGHVAATLFRDHWRALLQSLLLICSGTVASYTLNYMTTFGLTVLKLPEKSALAATFVLGICTFLFALIGGAWSDRIGRKALIWAPRLILLIGAYPLFKMMIIWPTVWSLLFVTIVLGVLNAVADGATLIVIPESFPGSVRSAGLAVSYALGVAVFGGTTQPVLAWLPHVTGNVLAAAWYLTAMSFVGLIVAVRMRETGRSALAH